MRAPVIAIVGGDSLLGRELREVLSEEFPRCRWKLVGAEEEDAMTLTEVGGEPAVLTPLDGEHLAEAGVALLAGSPAFCLRAAQLAASQASPPALVDFSYAFEDHQNARLRAPLLEEPRQKAEPGVVQVIAHPGAVIIASLLRALGARFDVRHSVIQIFEPASERGKAGVTELQDQSISLLSFKKLPKKVFDVQAGFNLLARYGEDAPVSLASVEERIEKHLASLLASRAHLRLPSLRLSHAPVFHGYCVSAWVELEPRPSVSEVEALLTRSGFDVRGGELEPPHNVGMAGQSGIATGAVALDRNHPRGMWFWLVADNLRLMVETSIPVIRELLAGLREDQPA